jgi:hypothetical protein
MNVEPTLEWITQKSNFNTTAFDDVPEVNISFTDAQGNCYVVYKTLGSIDGINFGQIIVFKTDKNGILQWVRQSATFPPNNQTFSTFPCQSPSIVVDDNGNVYVAYQFDNPSGFPLPNQNPIGTSDIVVFKLDTNGNLIWLNENNNVVGGINNGVFNTTSYNITPAIALDPNGNPVIAYSTGGNFPPNPPFAGTTLTGLQDIVVFKLDKNDSKLLWISQNNTFNAGAGAINNRPSISVDNIGNISICYETTGTAPGMGNSKTSNIGQIDVVVFQISSDGITTNWCKQNNTFNGSGLGSNLNPQISVNNENVFVTYQTINLVTGQTKTGQTDIVVFQLSSLNGSTNWALQNNTFNANSGTIDNFSPKIDIDSSENVYICYQTTGLAPLTPSDYDPSNNKTGSNDIVVFRLTGQVVEWCLQNSQFNANSPPSPPSNLEPSISVLGDGTGIYVTYYTNGKAVNNIPPGNVNENTGSYDIAVFKLSQPGPPTPPPVPSGNKIRCNTDNIYLVPNNNCNKFKYIISNQVYQYYLTNFIYR